MPIDTLLHLRNRNYPPEVQVKRLIWGVLAIAFRLSPAPLHVWRRFLLRCLGARVGRGVRIAPSTRIMFPWNLNLGDHVVIGSGVNLYALAPITIEASVLVSQGAHLCAGSHDYTQPHFPIAHEPITVRTGTWVAADVFIGPGVTIGRGAVVGARAVVMKDVADQTLVAGNPAQIVRKFASP